MNDFGKFFIKRNDDFFGELQRSCKCEPICKGRTAAILVDNAKSVPIVRTTTSYTEPAQIFSPIHKNLIEEVATLKNTSFNNIMFEFYTTQYKTMGLHSDHALDLDKDSWIALYSCYSNPKPKALRTLVVKNKKTLETQRVTLDHNSVVLFSLETNRNYLHQIILDNKGDEEWIGLTLRNSHTNVAFVNDKPFINDKPLLIATEEQTVEFRRKRAQENKRSDFYWPTIDYTISESDLLQIKGC